MSTDIHALLRDATSTPTSSLQVDNLIRTARHRQRVHRAQAVIGGAVIIAVSALIVVALTSSNGTHQVAINERDPSQIPQGWTKLNIPAAGLQLGLPPGWHQLPDRDTAGAQHAVTVGSTDLPGTAVITACTSAGQIPTQTGTWVSIYEYNGRPAQIVNPVGQTILGGFTNRPSDFRTSRPPYTGRCAPTAAHTWTGKQPTRSTSSTSTTTIEHSRSGSSPPNNPTKTL